MKKRTTITAMAFSLLVSLVLNLEFIPSLQAQTEPFYKGKTIRIVVGFPPGAFMTVGRGFSPATWENISRETPI